MITISSVLNLIHCPAPLHTHTPLLLYQTELLIISNLKFPDSHVLAHVPSVRNNLIPFSSFSLVFLFNAIFKLNFKISRRLRSESTSSRKPAWDQSHYPFWIMFLLGGFREPINQNHQSKASIKLYYILPFTCLIHENMSYLRTGSVLYLFSYNQAQ